VFQALGRVLGLYSNIAVAWMMAVVADLVINKPLGLSPPGIEFRRAYLYDINPVGVGAMGIASLLSVAAYVGLFGVAVQPWATFIAIGAAMIASPLIAWATGGRYYLARTAQAVATHTCCICNKEYESEDLAHCPAYQDQICSLCCSLDARCDDLCKPHARLGAQWGGLLQRLLPSAARPYLEAGLGHYLLLMAGILPVLGLLIGLLYYQEVLSLPADDPLRLQAVRASYVKISAALLLIAGVVAWWLVLTHKSRQVAQEESNRQTELLMREIESHRHTDALLQKAKQTADQANQAKSRYISAISHELRTPLNSILGYAQILDADADIPENRRQAVNVIRRSGDHLLSLIEGTLDIARIEGGKLTLDARPLDFPSFVQEIVAMFEPQARGKGISFSYQSLNELPTSVRTDPRRLRQILINLLGNAVKFTVSGGVVLRVRYQREMAHFEIEDSGPGIPPEELERIFEPFSRGSAAHGSASSGAAGGTGLGLTIAKMLTDLMGGEMKVESHPGQGSLFQVRLYLPKIHNVQATSPRIRRVGYVGVRQRILIVDNEATDREFLVNLLEPLGFQLVQAASGQECLDQIPRFKPHLICMDLAMPGMDGWETIRRLREGGLSDAEIVIISANAFDQGNDNEVGMRAEDFITKPVRIDDLLTWIGQRLKLEWVSADVIAEPTTAPPPTPWRAPPPDALRALQAQIELGYPRGISGQLDDIASDPAHQEFVEVMRRLAKQFQFDSMLEIIRKALAEHPHAT
jgi:signal transduction histidine kinase/DNA-binding NarL/FixJ family response regulator